MYIEPNSTFIILKHIPLDPTYENTLWFDSAEHQYGYFSSHTKYRLDRQYYQRVNKGTMRVELPYNSLYDCNYIMFRNTAYGDKWFYAFITNEEYINDRTTEISYEIDVMQTWHFDYVLEQSFVEREHSATDVVGENTIPENLEIGTYITTSSTSLLATQLDIYLFMTEQLTDPDIGSDYLNEPSTIGGSPIPCYWKNLGAYNSQEGRSNLNAYVKAINAQEKADAVIGFFALPAAFVDTTTVAPKTSRIILPTRTSSITPKNNKLLTYPFVCAEVTGGGQGFVLRYENFDTRLPGTQIINVDSNFGANMQLTAYPLDYEGRPLNWEYRITLDKWMQLPWIKDYFQNYLAYNKAKIVTNIATDVAGTALGVYNLAKITDLKIDKMHNLTRSAQIQGKRVRNLYSMAEENAIQKMGEMQAINAMASTAGNIANTLATVYQASVIPDSMVGGEMAGDVDAVTGKLGIYCACKSIKPEYANIVDDYFTLYGYATHRVKIPNRNVRPHWTYTKTVGCTIAGNCPADAESAICAIYDNGIRFWREGSEVGNYSLNNSV